MGTKGMLKVMLLGFTLIYQGAVCVHQNNPIWFGIKGRSTSTWRMGMKILLKWYRGSEISFFKNGICQGVAFQDLCGGRYYPAASMYTLPNQPKCVVKFNFGPDFEFFPEEFGSRPIPRPMTEVPYLGYDVKVENGNQHVSIRMWPMLKVVKVQGIQSYESC
ncbi:unnamed protein product [Camellia sinensis]